jgi:hypothetical protein
MIVSARDHDRAGDDKPANLISVSPALSAVGIAVESVLIGRRTVAELALVVMFTAISS